MVIDFVNGGELFTHLDQRKKFSEQHTVIFAAEIVLALEQLHQVSLEIRLIIKSFDHLRVKGANESSKFPP